MQDALFPDELPDESPGKLKAEKSVARTKAGQVKVRHTTRIDAIAAALQIMKRHEYCY